MSIISMNTLEQKTVERSQFRTSISSILSSLNYPSIAQSCSQCFAQISPSQESKICTVCLCCTHIKCLSKLCSQHFRIKKQSSCQSFQCRACIDVDYCLQCKNYLSQYDSNIYSCSVCLRKIHNRCHFLPTQFLKAHQHPITAKYSNLNHPQMICKVCLNYFGIKDIIDKQAYNGCNYYLILLNHPSHIHFTWIEELAIVQSSRNNVENNLVVISSPQVQVVLSIFIPQAYALQSIDKIERIVIDDQFIEKNQGKAKSFKFLTKWRNSFNHFSWEEASIFQKCKIHIIRFIHQLKMNSIASYIPEFLPFYKRNCIKEYVQKYDILQKIQPKGHIYYPSITSLRVDEKTSQDIDLKNVYSIYYKKRKQYLNIHSASLKADLICSLINLIYFHDKRADAVVIMTEQINVSWWVNNLSAKNSYLSTLSLYGPSSFIERIVKKYLYKADQKSFILKLDILIISYQSLKTVGNLINIRNLLNQFCLLILDGKMTPLAHFYYTNVKIARIKFYRENIKQVQANPASRNQIPQETNCSQKKSSLTLSISNNVKHFLSDSKLIIKSKFVLLCGAFYEDYFTNYPAIEANFYNESQRLIFLKYILYFGLNCTDNIQLNHKLNQFKSRYLESKANMLIDKLENYIHYFLAHVFTLSPQQAYSDNSELKIKKYFFFNIEPIYIYKLITNLARIKKFVFLFENQFGDFNIEKPSIFLKQKHPIVLQRWTVKYDFMICKHLLHHGFGRWQTMSESNGNWKRETHYLTFRQYLCQQLEIEISKSEIEQFFKKRVKQIISYLSKILL